MGYTLDIHPDIADDITEIANYLNQRDPGLGEDFVIAVDDTLDQLEQELSREFLIGRRFEHVFAKPVEGAKASPSYAKKFRKYCLWYEIEEETQRAYVCTIAYAGRHRDTIRQIIASRKDD